MQRCRKCGLYANYPHIRFNSTGICNYCAFYEKHKNVLEQKNALEKSFLMKMEIGKNKAKEGGVKYDCLAGLSGGKYSAFMICQLKMRYGMRVLAFTFDNGFATDYGRQNIQNVLAKLQIDHVTFSMNDETRNRKYAACIKSGHNFCAVCKHYMYYYSYLFAEQNKIPLILNGRPKEQILRHANRTENLEPFDAFFPLKKRARTDKNPEFISYFAYHDVREKDLLKFLERKIGWPRAKDAGGHPDCAAYAMAEKIHIEKRGFPMRAGELAVQTRRQRLTPDQAEKIAGQDMKRFREIPVELEKAFESLKKESLAAQTAPKFSFLKNK